MKSTKPTPPRLRHHELEGRKIISHGNDRNLWQDFYHLSLMTSWPRFFSAIVIFFITINALFAILYQLEPNSIANLYPQNFLGYFFFSIETLATVGYGDMHPQTIYSHTIASIQIFVGLTSVAVMTGLIFARFSKPRARIVFAEHPIVTTLNDQRMLMIRVANSRQNFISNATARLYILIKEVSIEGISFRRIYDLNLIRDNQPMFVLGWSLMHVIDENSPLYQKTAEDLDQLEASLIVQIVGQDESTAQEMQARHTYPHSLIHWNHRYVDAIYVDENDVTHIDYTVFHDTLAMPTE